MYTPIFTISNKILKNIGYIEGSKEIIESAPLVPSFEKQFQNDAMMRMIHHGTHLDGNDLTLYQVRKVLEGSEIYGKARDIQEVVNSKNAWDYLTENITRHGLYDKGILIQLHRILTDRIVVPEKSGVFRSTEVLVKEEGTGKVIFSPPPAIEVPYLLDDFFAWLNDPNALEMHPVIRASIIHYVLTAIFPFVQENGKVVRFFTNLILLKEGYGIKRFFSIEENFDLDFTNYYENLSMINQQSFNIGNRDLTRWIEYFSETLSNDLKKVKERVKKLSIDNKMKVKFGEQITLSERQMRLIEYISDRGSAGMGELKKVLPMVSEDTVLRELQELSKKGIIKKQGSTKASKYIISNK